MSDRLRRLREDAADELARHEGDDPPNPAAQTGEVEALLNLYYASQPESELFLDALEAVGEAAIWPDAPAGKAAASTAAYRAKRGRSVEEAIASTTATAREALVSHLRINRDAATLLLDRPASALASYPPAAVAAAADQCRRARGLLFQAIAASLRSSGNFVFAYRPGEVMTEAATRADGETTNALADLLDWGRALFAAPVEPDQTSR